MRVRSFGLPLFAVALLGVLHCGGAVDNNNPLPTPDSGPDPTADAASDGGSGSGNHVAVGATTASKVDLLLVVDNSNSMKEKADALAASAGTLINGLAKASDLHIGVIDTSLGSFGGDVCPDGTPGLNSLAHLHTTGVGGAAVAGAAQGFLSYNAGASLDQTIADTQALVHGVGETGCGLEAQLEAAYRFLVQPDPWQSVQITNAIATLQGVDTELLRERKAFLREDSLVVVVLLTDEDDSAVDPRSIGGQGWAFENTMFPGSVQLRADGKSSTAPRATSICATNPASADCTSCGYADTCNAADPSCQKIKNDPNCLHTDGYYTDNQEQLNVRFFHMKERFGIDPQFPFERYVDGFTQALVPNRDGEHTQAGGTLSPYLNNANCTNPLFASNLPASDGDETCNLPTGPRGSDLVVFAVIGGVPEPLATATPDWSTILGKDPDDFDRSGIDPHMIQSTTPRAGLPGPSSTVGDNGTDPISGREWDTNNGDLQYACTFALPAPIAPNASVAGDCADPTTNPPLCGADRSQTRGKAYPTIRELRVAEALGDRGVIGSICPSDATLGFVSTMQTLVARLLPRIQ